MNTTLVDIFQHNQWANLRLLEACAGLTAEQLGTSVGGTYGTIADTLLHLCAAEERYVTLLTGRTPDVTVHEKKGFPGISTLRQNAERSGAGLIAVAQNDPFSEILTGTHGSQRYEMRAVVPLLQAIHHAGEHRGQVLVILSQLGLEPPDLSGWAYGVEMGYDYAN